ncbi:MAG: hypothetical protein K2J83_07495, partial [Clostridia bacterium]|nr:hypothetical protein [Clostridia bacterium]
MALTRYMTNTNSETVFNGYVLDYGKNDLTSSVSLSNNTIMAPAAVNSQRINLGKGAISQNTTGNYVNTYSYNNTTSTPYDYELYFGFWANNQWTTQQYSSYMTYSVALKESVAITPATAPALDGSSVANEKSFVYDGADHYFTFTWDADYSALTSVVKQTFSGVSTTIYSYDIATQTPNGTNPIISGNQWALKEVGIYTVTFDILGGSKWEDTNGNETRKFTITIERAKLSLPTISPPQSYTGLGLMFTLANFNLGQDISMDGVTPPNGATVTDAVGVTPTDTTDTFKATNVGKYTVTLNLRDTNNYTWTDGTTTAKTVDFEITKKELFSSAPTSSKTNSIGSAEWKYKDNTVTVEITDDRVSGETVSLAASYDVQGSTSSPIPLTANMTTSGNVTTIAMPDNIAVGKYTLYVTLNGTSGDNGNYQITKNNTLDFEVTAAAVDPSNYTWIYTKDGAAGGTISDGDKLPFVLKTGSAVDGVKYELSIQIPSSDSVAVDTSKYASGYQLRSGDSVGTYKTVVALKSTDPTFQFEV